MQSGNKKQNKTYKYRKEKMKLLVVANFGWVTGPRYLVILGISVKVFLDEINI